jgi:cell division protein FtsL
MEKFFNVLFKVVVVVMIGFLIYIQIQNTQFLYKISEILSK